MDKINIDNLNDMEVLGLYDDIIAWTAHKCEIMLEKSIEK